MAELGFGEELEDGGGHDVRGGVADDAERGGVVLLEQLEGDVFVERRGEVDDASRRRLAGPEYMASSEASRAASFVVGGCGGQRLDAGDDDGGGEARGDAVGDVEGGGAGGDFADGAVGKLNWIEFDWVAHDIRIEQSCGLRWQHA